MIAQILLQTKDLAKTISIFNYYSVADPLEVAFHLHLGNLHPWLHYLQDHLGHNTQVHLDLCLLVSVCCLVLLATT